MSSSADLAISVSRALAGTTGLAGGEQDAVAQHHQVRIAEMPNSLSQHAGWPIRCRPCQRTPTSGRWRLEAASKIGADMRRGPHHAQQKSISTMPSRRSSAVLSGHVHGRQHSCAVRASRRARVRPDRSARRGAPPAPAAIGHQVRKSRTAQRTACWDPRIGTGAAGSARHAPRVRRVVAHPRQAWAGDVALSGSTHVQSIALELLR